jgi:DNA polymerase III delta prime subunit
MSEQVQQDFDARRRAYLSGRLTVMTPAVQNLIKVTEITMEQNQHAPTGRRGILVTGPSTVGKTTACLTMMRYAYGRFLEQMPATLAEYAIPLAYVEVPPSSTPKGMMQRFADFYALPYANGTTLNELKREVVGAMRTNYTQIVVVDELHNLALKNPMSGQSVDTLKDLSNSSPATFIYAGIKLEESGLLSGPRGEQVARRFTPIRMTRTRRGGEWRKIVKDFVQALPLFRSYVEDSADANAEGRWKELADWLHTRTGGNIGTLQSLLTQAAFTLIRNHDPAQEKITRELLQRGVLDISALAKSGGAPPVAVPGRRSTRGEADHAA